MAATRRHTDGLKNIFGLLTSSRKIRTNETELLGTLQRKKRTGDLLFDFHYEDISLSLIVVKRHEKVSYECEYLFFEVSQKNQQVHGG